MSTKLPANTITAIARFRDEVYARSREIDPVGDHDWHDIALGFLLACGVPRDTLTWTLLTHVSCGAFEPYLFPETIEEFAQRLFEGNPTFDHLRVGYAWGINIRDTAPEVWAEATDEDGNTHVCDPQCIPETILKWVQANIPVGMWKDYHRDSQ